MLSGMPCRIICIFRVRLRREETESEEAVAVAISFMKYRMVYERSVNVVASSLAMAAQRLPFLKSLTPIFGATGGVNLAAPLAVSFVGTHALSGQSVMIVPLNGATENETITAGDQFVWSFKSDRYAMVTVLLDTAGFVEPLPAGLDLFGPQSGAFTIGGIPTEPGEYVITMEGYRRTNLSGGTTVPYVLRLTVEAGGSPFDDFLATFWSGDDLSNPELVAPTADPDGDGIDNALEFVLDLDPTKSDAMPGTMGVDPNDETMFRYEIPLNTLAGAASASFQESPNLDGNFTEVAAEGFTRTDESIVLRVPLATKKFYRLKVIL